MAKLTHPYGLDLARAKSLLLWTPKTAGAATVGDIGLPMTQAGGTITLQAPGNAIGTYMHRMRFANAAGAPNNTSGIWYPTAAHHPFRRGTTDNVHGFYCSIRFTLGVWNAGDTDRFFVGISNDTLNMAAQDSTASVATDYYGIGHDTVDGANELYFLSRNNNGTRSKVPISGGAQAPVLAAGRSFWLEMFAWSNQATMSLTLWDLNTGALLYNTTGGMSDAVWTGPHVAVSNGSVAGNVAAIDPYNIYGFVGD